MSPETHRTGCTITITWGPQYDQYPQVALQLRIRTEIGIECKIRSVKAPSVGRSVLVFDEIITDSHLFPPYLPLLTASNLRCYCKASHKN